MDADDLKNRTKNFAHQCIKLALALPDNPLGRHVRSQLIKCSTALAANYRAAYLSQSKANFVSKLSIVIEEADETCFWKEFIIKKKLVEEKKIVPLLDEVRELAAIFVATRKTAKDKSLEFIADSRIVNNH